MDLKASRTLLSIILAVIVAISTVATLSSLVLNATILNKGFIMKHAVSDEMINDCNKQLDAKFSALEAESGIPARVFKTVQNDYSTGESLRQAVSFVFDEENELLYNKERIAYFERLCQEYLDGNDIKYDKDDIYRVAEKAAMIYSDTVGIHNIGAIEEMYDKHSVSSVRVTSSGCLAIAVCAILLVVMFKKRSEGYKYLNAGLSGGAVATIICSILGILTKIGGKFNIQPIAYLHSFQAMAKTYFSILIVAGFALIVVCNFILFSILQTESKNGKAILSNIEFSIKGIFK